MRPSKIVILILNFTRIHCDYLLITEGKITEFLNALLKLRQSLVEDIVLLLF